MDRVRARHVAAVNAGDPEAALDIFAPDAAVMPPGQPALQGAALRAWFTHVFANFSLHGFRDSTRCWRAVRERRDRAWQLERHAATQERITKPACRRNLRHRDARLADGSVRVIKDIFNGMPG